jgi:hypothetical protein
MAYMQAKGLYKSLLDKEVLMPEVTPLTEAATAEERAEWAAQLDKRNQQIKEIDERLTFGVILRWHQTKQGLCIFDMIACPQAQTERVMEQKRSVYYSNVIQTWKSLP